MLPASLLRVIVTTVLLLFFILVVFHGGTEEAYAGTPDKVGNNAEIFSVSITPNSVPAGTYPEISGFVRNTSSSKNGKNGKAIFDVTALITAPNGSQKNLLWHNVSFSGGQKKFYTYANNYDNNQVGTYRVVYSVYNSGRTHLYTSLSKSFTITNHLITSKPVQPQKEPVSKAMSRSETQAQQGITIERKKPSSYNRRTKTESSEERMHFGIGASLNTLNTSGGPTLILWPFKNLAVQGAYGIGTFTSYEVRTFYRFPLSRRFNPYLGAGYLHAERKTNVIGIDTTVTGDGITGFGGVELPVSKNLYAYIDVSGTSMKLQKDVTNGGSQATATVKYIPITINAGLVFYLF